MAHSAYFVCREKAAGLGNTKVIDETRIEQSVGNDFFALVRAEKL